MFTFISVVCVIALQMNLVTSEFSCPRGSGYFPDPVQCDRYFECRDGIANPKLCKDGMVFIGNNPLYERCDFPFNVKCGDRTQLQEAVPSTNCPRRNGIFPHSNTSNCKTFWQCVDGIASKMSCQTGLAFNPKSGTCQWKYLVPQCQGN